MKNQFVFLIFFLVILNNSFSQYVYPKKENAEKVLGNKLSIQLLDEKTESEKYLNQALKDVFMNNWKLTEIVFLDKNEINKLKNSKQDGYTFLTQNDKLREDIRSGYMSSDGRMHKIGFGNAGDLKFDYTAFTFSYYDFNLEIINNNKLTQVTKIGFANGELSKIDYLFLCLQIKNLIENAAKDIPSNVFYDVERNIEKCKNSKLILLKDLFKEKDQTEIKSLYEFEYELVDRDKYQDIILNQEKSQSYVKIIWSHHHEMYMWIVVDAENGSIISQMGFGGVQFGKNHSANEIIKAKHLKYITNKTSQKINSKY